MKMWMAMVALAGLAAVAAPVAAQTLVAVPIGNIPRVEDRGQAAWAMSGFTLFNVKVNQGQDTPITRTLKYDARTVEILSRAQTPPLRASDVKVISRSGRHYVAVRRFMLAEVTPQDARAERVNTATLAKRWAASVRRVLPQVAPQPGLGI